MQAESLDVLVCYGRSPTKENLAKVIDTYGKFVWDTAVRLTGSQETAGDITQNVWLELMLNYFELDRIRNPRAYLFFIIRGLVRDLRREKKRSRQLADADSVSKQESMPVFTDEEIDAVLVALKCLLTYRVGKGVELIYLDGLSVKDTANILRFSERNLRRKIEKALKKLRRAFETEGFAGFLNISQFFREHQEPQRES